MVNGILPNGAKVGFRQDQRCNPTLSLRAHLLGYTQIAPLAFWGMQRTADCMSSEQCNFCSSHGTIAQSTSPRAVVHAFAIDRQTRQIIGSTRFYGYDSEKSEIEIGWTFLARKYWGGRYNAEMKRLLLNHAFKFVETVIFLVGEENIRSQKAMEKVGGIKAGTATRTYGNREPARNVKYVIRKL